MLCILLDSHNKGCSFFVLIKYNYPAHEDRIYLIALLCVKIELCFAEHEGVIGSISEVDICVGCNMSRKR